MVIVNEKVFSVIVHSDSRYVINATIKYAGSENVNRTKLGQIRIYRVPLSEVENLIKFLEEEVSFHDLTISHELKNVRQPKSSKPRKKSRSMSLSHRGSF